MDKSNPKSNLDIGSFDDGSEPNQAPKPNPKSITIENEKEIRAAKTKYQVTNWTTKEKKYGHLNVQNFEPVDTAPDE
jgi:hypothetical protein